jgi:hypothetical protein
METAKPSESPPHAKRWNYWILGASLIIGGVLQVGLCVKARDTGFVEAHTQTGRCQAAFLFDSLILLRMLLSVVLGERNRRWIVYSVMCITSAWWIRAVFKLVGMLKGVPIFE